MAKKLCFSNLFYYYHIHIVCILFSFTVLSLKGSHYVFKLAGKNDKFAGYQTARDFFWFYYFFFKFPTKVARDHVHTRQEKSPVPGA